MILRFMTGVVAVSLLAGCATTQQPTAVNQLQIRVAQIERQLDRYDQDVTELKYSVEDLAARVKSGARPAWSAEAGRQAAPAPSAPAPKSDRQPILRVAVTPQEVQTALRNAGYYKGAVDGKLGPESQNAIMAFQKDHDLGSDGIVGKKTWAELKNYLE